MAKFRVKVDVASLFEQLEKDEAESRQAGRSRRRPEPDQIVEPTTPDRSRLGPIVHHSSQSGEPPVVQPSGYEDGLQTRETKPATAGGSSLGRALALAAGAVVVVSLGTAVILSAVSSGSQTGAGRPQPTPRPTPSRTPPAVRTVQGLQTIGLGCNSGRLVIGQDFPGQPLENNHYDCTTDESAHDAVFAVISGSMLRFARPANGGGFECVTYLGPNRAASPATKIYPKEKQTLAQALYEQCGILRGRYIPDRIGDFQFP